MNKIVVILTLALFIIFSSVIVNQYNSYREYLNEENYLAAELEKERETLMKLEREKEQYMSDAYVEKIAREIGLVRHDEIVFINDASK